jgi:hypothetical protein
MNEGKVVPPVVYVFIVIGSDSTSYVAGNVYVIGLFRDTVSYNGALKKTAGLLLSKLILADTDYPLKVNVPVMVKK